MSVRGEYRPACELRSCACDRYTREPEGRVPASFGSIASVEQKRRRDLIVPASPGVQHLAGVAWRKLAHACVDCAVNVFKSALSGESLKLAALDLVANLVERVTQRRRGRSVGDTAALECVDMSERTCEIERCEHEVAVER